MSPTTSSPTQGGNPGPALVDLAIGFIVFESVALALFYTARYIHTKHISEIEMVYFIPLGYLFCVGNSIVSILMVKIGGAGRHVQDLDMETLMRLGKLFKAAELIYLFSVMFPKLAILSLYIRLFMNPIRRLSYLTAVMCIAVVVAGIITFGFACQPFAYNWDKTIAGGHCINTNISYAYYSLPNVVSDVAILLLPIQPLWKLQVSRSTKLGLFVTFALGSFGTITAILRFALFVRSNIRVDPSYASANTMRWTIIEPATYQIAATVPTLRPVFTKSVTILSQLSNSLRSRNSDERSDGIDEHSNRDNFVKLDDYHYMHNSRGSKDKRNHSGVLKTTALSISSCTNADLETGESERQGV